MTHDFFQQGGRQLVDTINSGVAVYEVRNEGLSGRDYVVLFFNQAALALEGKTSEEVVGKSLFDLRPNIDEFGLIPVFCSVWKSGKPALYPARVYVDDTFSNWYENRVFRLSPNQIVAVYDDVTDRMNAQEALRRSESLLREVVNSMEKAIAIYAPVDDGDDFVFVEMNEFAERITHYQIGEVVGKRLTDMFPGESSIGLIGKLKETWKTGRTTHIPLKQYKDDRITQWVEHTLFKLPSGKVVAMFEDTFEQRAAEAALKEREETLRSYIDNAPDGFFLADENGRHVEVNAAAERMTGYSRDELLGMSIVDLVPSDAKAEVRTHFQTVLNTGVSEGAVPFLRKNGQRRMWSVKAVRLSSSRLMAFTRDTTELHRVEDSLRESDARYRLAEQIGRLGNWEYTVRTGEFLGSPEARRIYGFGPDDESFTAEEVESCIPERERVHQALVDLIENDTLYDLEFDIIPVGSSVRRTITSTAKLSRDASGVPLRVSGIIQDITGRKQVENALRASEGRYRSLFNSIRDAILVADTNREIIDCNPAFSELFGYRREDVLGKNTSVIYANQSEYWERGEALKSRVDPGVDHPETTTYKKSNGEVFPGETNVFLLHDDDGAALGFIGSIRDVTERRHLEEQIRQSQKMDAVGKLAGGVAHDFNNLLTIINGYSDMLLEAMEPNQEGYEDLKQIEQAGRRAAALTSQLLAFSRKQVLEPEILDVNRLILHTNQMLQRLIGEHIVLTAHLDPLAGAIKADRSQFEQIIMNLFVNARDAMPKGGKLTIETQSVDLDEAAARKLGVQATGRVVMIAVSDDGVGMHGETLARIFEPFFTTKEAGKGTGMGLSTVFGIVKQSNGDILAFSEPGRGTTFRIYFPAVDIPVRATSLTPERRLPAAQEHEVILIVEDEPGVRKIIERALHRSGYEFISASSGQDALEKIRSVDRPIDLLLTDVIMPGMSGKALADAFRATRPDVKVCFMSGYTDDAIGQHGMLADDVHFIQKPFAPLALVDKIRSILRSA